MNSGANKKETKMPTESLLLELEVGKYAVDVYSTGLVSIMNTHNLTHLGAGAYNLNTGKLEDVTVDLTPDEIDNITDAIEMELRNL